jgi:hypothetical protein
LWTKKSTRGKTEKKLTAAMVEGARKRERQELCGVEVSRSGCWESIDKKIE